MKNRRFTPYFVLAGFTSALITTNLAFEDPVPVHADLGSFVGAVDYILATAGDEAIAAASGGNAVVRGIMLGIYLCTRNPLPVGGYYDADNVTVISGLYKYNNEIRNGYEFFTNNQNLSSDAPYTFATAYDFEISVSGSINSYSSSTSYNNYFSISLGSTSNSLLSISNTRANGLFTAGSYSARGNPPNYYYRFGGNLSTSGTLYKDWDLYPTTSLSDIFYYEPVDANNVIQVRSSVTLPSGEIDPANPDVYIENVLRPWVVENYPEYIYLLPEPPQPESQYATDDIVPGIPKDWTIINPELPTAPHFEINVPDADFSVLDVSETIAQYVIPIGFWFTLLDQTLDALHLKVILYVALAFGLLIYIVWKLGR